MEQDAKNTPSRLSPLFLDEPTDIDLLSFDAVASTITDALLDPRLDPIALGLSGSWGSGKTSVLRLISAQLQSDEIGQKCIVIETDPWRYDPQLGIKESLISEILKAIESELPNDSMGEKSKHLVKRLAGRVNWTKAMKLAAKSSIMVSLPSIDDVLALVRSSDEVGNDQPEPITDMVQFRAEFEELLGSEGLKDVSNIVILVDDLDRCLPDTVVETLETIRLFLSVPKMSFVIAADEERVAEAIATRYPSPQNADAGEESPARLYLHKIVQTSVPLPALSDFDTEAYLILLQIRSMVSADEYSTIIEEVVGARMTAAAIETISSLGRSDFDEARNNAERIRPIVHEKTRGNPRRIKRFLNDLSVRLSIAQKRGIELDSATIAKLMVLEQYFPDDFKIVTDWLLQQTLRTNLELLESAAGTPPTKNDEEMLATDEAELTASTDREPQAESSSEDVSEKEARFSDGLIRWARLSPALAKKDIAPYLVFAASFKNLLLTSESLPEAIRDIATQLLSRSPTEARRVTDDILQSLQASDVAKLVHYLGGAIIDEPQKQSSGITAMLRITRVHAQSVDGVVKEIQRIKPVDLKIGGLISLQKDDAEEIFTQLSTMAESSGKEELKNAIAEVQKEN